MGFAEYQDWLIPIGNRCSMMMKCGPQLWSTIRNHQSDTEEDKQFVVYKRFVEMDKIETMLADKIIGYLNDSSIQDENVWLDIFDLQKEPDGFYKGDVVEITYISSTDEKITIMLNKTILPAGIKKKDFNSIKYTVLPDDDVFILRKEFKPSEENGDDWLTCYIILRIIR